MIRYESMASKAFIDVLVEQIRADLRAEVEAEVKAEFETESLPKKPATPNSAEIADTWLSAHVAKNFFAKFQSAKKAYVTRKPPPQTAPPIAKRSATSSEDLLAATLLERASGLQLAETFSEDELKALWRRAALKTHPDRFANDPITQTKMNAKFTELAEAYDRLSDLF